MLNCFIHPSTQQKTIPMNNNTHLSSETFSHILTEEKIAHLQEAKQHTQQSLADLLEFHAPKLLKNLQKDITQLKLCETRHIPIIGVCGMMNTGKSTLVASLLSEEGKRRVLIGDGMDEGTHRFVLWAPLSWKNDPELLKATQEFLSSAFDGDLEELSDTPEAAAQQYNAVHGRVKEFHVPLIAFDSALDQHGLCIMDCPDIQRSHDNEIAKKTARIREKALARATKICSGFFVVSSSEQQEAEKMKDIFEILLKHNSTLPLHVVTTKCHRDAIAKKLEETQKTLDNFKINLSFCRIFLSPRVDAGVNGFPKDVYYVNEDLQPADLSEVCGKLESCDLLQDHRNTLSAQVKSHSLQALKNLEAIEQQQKETIQNSRKTTLSFLETHFLKNNTLTPIFDESLSKEMMESLERTAPFSIRALFFINKPVSLLAKHIKNAGRNILRRGKPTISPAKVTPEMFANSLEGHSWLPADSDKSSLQKIWNQAANSAVSLSAHRESCMRRDLDNSTKKLWKEVSTLKKLLINATLPFTIAASFAAVLFIPFDGGTTVLMLASVKEILAAFGLGFLANSLAMKAMEKTLEDHAARPQQSNLFALLQDGLGIPRANAEELSRMSENVTLQLTESELSPSQAVIHLLDTPAFSLDQEKVSHLKSKLSK